MKKLLFAIGILFGLSVIGQPFIEIGAGQSTSQPFGMLTVGFVDDFGHQGGATMRMSDKMHLITLYGGYNAILNDNWRLNAVGGGGYLNHNIQYGKDGSITPKTASFVPMLSGSIDYHYSRIGSLSLGAFSALKIHGISLSLKCYIDK